MDDFVKNINKSKILLSISVVIGLIIVASLHWQHQMTFNRPKDFNAIRLFLQKSSAQLLTSKWTVVHVLAGRCACSGFLSQYLVERKSNIPADVQELVILIDPVQKIFEKLKNAGFELFEISPEEVVKQKLDISGLPLLIIYDQNNLVRYAGGYSDAKINPFTDYHDIEILQNLQKNIPQQEFAIRGCVVAKEYQAILDPLGLKYSN